MEIQIGLFYRTIGKNLQFLKKSLAQLIKMCNIGVSRLSLLSGMCVCLNIRGIPLTGLSSHNCFSILKSASKLLKGALKMPDCLHQFLPKTCTKNAKLPSRV